MTRPWRWLVLLALTGCYFETPTHGGPEDEIDSAIINGPVDGEEGGSTPDPDGGSAPNGEGGIASPEDAGDATMGANRDGSMDSSMAVSDTGVDSGPPCMCAAAAPICLPSRQCVQCTTGNTGACTGDKPVCDYATSTCVACTADSQCPSAARAKCDLTTKSCVPCDAKAQCTHVGSLPVCSSGTCVQCSASDALACTGTKPVCQTNGNTCVACNTNANCTDPTKPTCDANVCRACQNEGDCAGKMSGSTALDACYSGQCVDCRVNPADTKLDIGCSATTSCNPSTRTCAGKTKGSLTICAPCLADAECPDDHRCITMTYQGTEVRPGGTSGGFCLRQMAAGSCPAPYGTTITRASRSGATADGYCGVNETLATCDASRIAGTLCPSGVSTCDIPEGRDALGARCAMVTGAQRCTYRCSSGNNAECPGNMNCPASTDAYCGGQ